MKKLLLSIVLLLSVANLQAQSISHIETTKNWYYIYDQDGKEIKTLSSTIGELQGFSSTLNLTQFYKLLYIRMVLFANQCNDTTVFPISKQCFSFSNLVVFRSVCCGKY